MSSSSTRTPPENAGQADARAIATTLCNLAGELDAVRPAGPVVLLIGDVVARAGAGEAMCVGPALRSANG